jgi:hypothetical protein
MNAETARCHDRTEIHELVRPIDSFIPYTATVTLQNFETDDATVQSKLNNQKSQNYQHLVTHQLAQH